ncbi:3'-5' exonuclease [Photobacterium sp. R1]
MKLMNLHNAVILDTETTGLGLKDEIVEVSVINALDGTVLFDSLVNPQRPIPWDAIAIHGIGNHMVADSPDFGQIWPQLFNALNGRNLLVYNADFDTRMIIQSLKASTGESCDLPVLSTTCVMEWYAEFWGDWDDARESYRWQKLTDAAKQQQLDISGLSAHRALADCAITRRLINEVNYQLALRY